LNNAYFVSALILFFFFYSVLRPWKRKGMMCFCFRIAGSQEGYSQDGCPDTGGEEKGVPWALLLLKNGSCKWG
jgi:hypothetical protein